ncbi:MAG TPA: thioredoxin family protein [Planctomycetes bacterium]|nr:thioredoxin family protein [Planctomycetota bacterium]
MVKIEVLGTGCKKCEALTEAAKTAVESLGLDGQIEKITAISEITKRGVMLTPALAVNGAVVVQGKVPDVDDLCALIKKASEK